MYSTIKSMAAATVLAVGLASGASATTIGSSVVAVGDLTPAPAGPAPSATEAANLLAGAAGTGATVANIVGYLIPLNGVDTIDVILGFAGVAGGHSTLSLFFEDLDLIGDNDPDFFLEQVTVSGAGFADTTFTNIADANIVPGPGIAPDSTAIATFDLGVLTAGSDYFATLTFSTQGNFGGSNSPEFLIGTVSPVPLPAALPLLLVGLGGLGLMRRRRSKS